MRAFLVVLALALAGYPEHLPMGPVRVIEQIPGVSLIHMTLNSSARGDDLDPMDDN